jgi:hypothetical protein
LRPRRAETAPNRSRPSWTRPTATDFRDSPGSIFTAHIQESVCGITRFAKDYADPSRGGASADEPLCALHRTAQRQ